VADTCPKSIFQLLTTMIVIDTSNTKISDGCAQLEYWRTHVAHWALTWSLDVFWCSQYCAFRPVGLPHPSVSNA